jgi:DNA replication protein DnaC
MHQQNRILTSTKGIRDFTAGEAGDRVLARTLRVDRPLTVDPDTRRRAGLLRELLLDVGQRYHPASVSLLTFQSYHANQAAVLERLATLAERLDVLTAEGSGLVFYGPCGTGKDHLAIALLYQAANRFGLPCRWVSGLEVFGTFRDNMDAANAQREADILERLTTPEILCISDPLPPVGTASAWNVQVLYRLLDRRYHALRPTWATMNVADPSDANSRLSKPVFDRLRDRAELVHCNWPSWRSERRA